MKKLLFVMFNVYFDTVRSIDPDKSSRDDLSGCEAADRVENSYPTLVYFSVANTSFKSTPGRNVIFGFLMSD